ncbi:neutral zinc metallopeptidase [Nonomuraea sp. NPDC050310]|uniref:neutral zinc metallopeptidase n=1 Tax=unclassified Nonomuraea TaxID=2593643 RepID=UPI0033D55248
MLAISAGTAHAPATRAAAEPAGAGQRAQAARVATHSPLYRTGKLARTGCAPGTLEKDDVEGYKRFLVNLTGCLNRAWGAEFRQANLSFAPPALRFVTAPVTTGCGPWATGADGVYCSEDRTIYMLINQAALRQPFALGVARLLAHEYGHHVQESAGIWHYYWTARSAAGVATRLQLSRRSELQAECLSAVFMSSIKESFPVDQDEWDYAVNWFRRNGHKGWAQNDHGKGATQAVWMERGFASASPLSCNTWAAKSAAVS